MNTERKLLKLKNEMRDLEKKEQRLTGTLEALFKAVKKDLGDDDLDEKNIVKVVRAKIKELEKGRGKAQDQFNDKMEIIVERTEALEA